MTKQKILRPSWGVRLLLKVLPGIKKQVISWLDVGHCTHVEKNGLLFPIETDVMTPKFALALAMGQVEKEEIALSTTYVTADDHIIEFGSGYGFAAALTHHATKPASHICYEVNPTAQAYCKAMMTANDIDITIVPKALGDGSNTAFYLCDDYVKSGFQKPHDTMAYRQIEVPTICLSEACSSKHPTILICDVEGAELAFLTVDRLKSKACQSLRGVMIELHPAHYGQEGMDDMISRFYEAGFAIKEQQGDCIFFARDVAVAA